MTNSKDKWIYEAKLRIDDCNDVISKIDSKIYNDRVGLRTSLLLEITFLEAGIKLIQKLSESYY